MKKIAIFYATKGGTTKAFAEQIAQVLGADIFDMKDTEVSAMNDYKTVVLMSSNYFFGALAEDWGSKVKLLNTVDFSDKNIAIVGVGGQERHPDSFCSGAADFYDKLAYSGARFIGEVEASDYKYTFSRFQHGAYFRGLCLDKGDGDKNTARINAWAEKIKKYL